MKVLDTIAFSGKGGESVTGDVLVFKNGDELPGKLLGTGNGAAVKWKTPAGFEVEIQPARVAGVRFAVKPLKVVPPPGSGVAQSEAPKSEKPKPEGGEPKPSPATLELKNGDRFPGELVAVGKDSLRFKHAVLGEREIPRSELWSYFTTLVTDGSATWMDVDPESSARRASTPDRWITLDGAYFTRAGTATPGYSDYSYLSQNGLKLPPRYEVRCDATSFGPNEPYFTIMLSSKTGSSQLNFSFSYNELNISGYSQRANVNGRSFSAEVPLRGKLEPSNRRMMRLLVDSEKGTVAVLLDGVLLKKVGTKKDEMFVGLGNSISFSSYSGYSLTKLSNFWIGPWSGELPDFSKEKAGSVALTNGDVAAGQILALNEGKMRVETEVGEFEMPMERVSSVEFGGTATPAKAAGRLRMRDGAVFHVDEFVFDADSISGKSAVLGEMKFPVTDISELIISPPMVRFPFGPVPKKPAEKPAEATAVVDPAAPKDLPAQ